MAVKGWEHNYNAVFAKLCGAHPCKKYIFSVTRNDYYHLGLLKMYALMLNPCLL